MQACIHWSRVDAACPAYEGDDRFSLHEFPLSLAALAAIGT